jgi:hypothetical protein
MRILINAILLYTLPARGLANGIIESDCKAAFAPPAASSVLKLNLGRARAIAGVKLAGKSNGDVASKVIVEVSMTDEDDAPRVVCNGEKSAVFDTSTGDAPHTILCDSLTVAQFVWVSDQSGLSLCEVAILEDTAEGAGGSGADEELPLNIMVHASGYVVDPTPPDLTTATPTPAPTSPTWSPTVPTGAPTFSPTLTPTLVPTLTPTKGPDCTNNREDGTETDIDCGGHGCPACGETQRCYGDLDCEEGRLLCNHVHNVLPVPYFLLFMF